MGFYPDVNLCTTSGIEPNIVPDISITHNIQIHFRYISTSGIPNISTPGFSKLTQIHAHTSYCCVTLSKHPFFTVYNLVSRLYVLRSLPNLHHRKDLLLARRYEYKLFMFLLRGFEVIGCQSPKILTPDLTEPRDPYPPRYNVTHRSHQSTWTPIVRSPRIHLGSCTLYKPPPSLLQIHFYFGHRTVKTYA